MPTTLNEGRLKIMLAHMGHDVEAFVKAYDSLPGARQNLVREPSPEELAAVEEFVRTGDPRSLRSKLQRKDRAYVNAVVTRVLAWKCQRTANW